MATTIVSVKEDFKYRTFTTTLDNLSATRSFIVICSDTSETSSVDVQAAVGIPSTGDAYPITFTTGVSLSAPICVSKTSQLLHDNDPNQWRVICQYSDANVRLQSIVNITPVRVAKVLETVPYYSAALALADLPNPTITGTTGPYKVVNNALDPYDPPLMGENVNLVYTITQNYASTVACETWVAFIDCMNDASVTLWGSTFEANTLRILNVNPQKVNLNSDGSNYAWRVTFEIEWNGMGQYIPVLETGWEYLTTTGEALPFMLADGTKKRTPGWLDANGEENLTDDPVYSGYWPYESISFSTFSLPAAP